MNIIISMQTINVTNIKIHPQIKVGQGELRPWLKTYVRARHAYICLTTLCVTNDCLPDAFGT
jgi:hypothetical protein